MLSMSLDLENFELPPLDEADLREREVFQPPVPVGGVPPKTMKLWHETVVSMMLTDPARTKRSIAKELGVTEAWLCTVTNSDMFRAYLAEHKDKALLAPAVLSLQARVEGVAEMALSKLEDTIPLMTDPRHIIDAADKILHRAGYAPQTKQVAAAAVGTQNNYITVSGDVLREARTRMHNQDVVDAHVITAPTNTLPSGG